MPSVSAHGMVRPTHGKLVRWTAAMLTVAMLWNGRVVEAEPTEDQAIVRVLIVTGMDHPAHDWRQTTAALQEELGKDRRMVVDVMDDPYQLSTRDLTPFQVVFLHFNNWQKPDPDERAQQNLRRFVEQGGGLVLLHFACGAFGEWEGFVELAGMVWDRQNTHDPRGPFTVRFTDADHPITRGLEDFQADDELYTGLTGDQPVKLLAVARSTVTGRDHPMAFTHTYGRGRVFHTPLGHDARAIHVPGTAELIRRGVAWAGGVPPVPESEAQTGGTGRGDRPGDSRVGPAI